MSRKHFMLSFKKRTLLPKHLTSQRSSDREVAVDALKLKTCFCFLSSFGGVQNVFDSPKIRGFFIVNLLDG